MEHKSTSTHDLKSQYCYKNPRTTKVNCDHKVIPFSLKLRNSIREVKYTETHIHIYFTISSIPLPCVLQLPKRRGKMNEKSVEEHRLFAITGIIANQQNVEAIRNPMKLQPKHTENS